jgi:hypothetical protein
MYACAIGPTREELPMPASLAATAAAQSALCGGWRGHPPALGAGAGPGTLAAVVTPTRFSSGAEPCMVMR